MTPENQAPEIAVAATAETVEIQDLDQFVAILTGWHTKQVEVVRHMLTVPEGATFMIGDGPEAKEVVLVGDGLKGFKLGIELALMSLGKLPFVAEVEDTPADEGV